MVVGNILPRTSDRCSQMLVIQNRGREGEQCVGTNFDAVVEPGKRTPKYGKCGFGTGQLSWRTMY